MSKRNFSDIFSKYKKYDPARDGYGSSQQWKSAFSDRMGWDEAVQTVGTDLPEDILSVPKSASVAEIKSAWRKWAQRFHPDKFPPDRYSTDEIKAAESMFKKGLAAYTILINHKR